MKNALPITLFLVLFFTDFLREQLKLLPEVFIYLPEAFYALIAIIAIVRIIARKTLNIPIRYIITFMGFLYVVIAGIIINDVSTITTIAGIRAYFKYVPMFLLPLAYDYSKDDIKKQFIVLLSLGLIQLPVTIWQSFFLNKHVDFVTGTLSISNSLSIVMVGLILMLLALYLRQLISLKIFLIFSIILFLPATLNETKVTPILLLSGFSALLFAIWKYLTSKQIVTFMASGIFLLSIFILAYNTQFKGSYFNNMSSDRLISNYNYKGYKADPNEVFDIDDYFVGEHNSLLTLDNQTGRMDSILIPLDVLYNNDIIRLLFGFGISNVTSSGGDAAYIHLNSLSTTQTTIAQLIWETGLLGTFLFVMLMVFVARDAFVLSRYDNAPWTAFSCGWFAITITLLITLGYNNLFSYDELMCLFMYFSSVIVVKKYHSQVLTTINNNSKLHSLAFAHNSRGNNVKY
jgi:hypothetical protein